MIAKSQSKRLRAVFHDRTGTMWGSLSHQSSAAVMEMNCCTADCDFMVIADTTGVIQGDESTVKHSSPNPALFPCKNTPKEHIQNRRPSSVRVSPSTLSSSSLGAADVEVSAIGHYSPTGKIKHQQTSDVELEVSHGTQQTWCANTQLLIKKCNTIPPISW